ncbi:AAA family ATPase [Agromyces intestinalis]|uniref:AAA family ATPase n=1 Tax=Agromyces intestinalis TaxID=2592652 RepID=A0A5C1YBR8_9MICO|nr:LuxR family transcriptional regulator [Agromyces intestinalis]QEO13070.1 AAA family ATPase [Agromyces intestinalis]
MHTTIAQHSAPAGGAKARLARLPGVAAFTSRTARDRGAARGLVGRERESDELTRLVGRVRDGESQALVLRGEAGIGKTALLHHLTQLASDSGCLVVESAGVESEMELAYAGLHQLCLPLLPHVDFIPARQRAALDTVFGAAGGDSPDRFLVGLAVLSLISESARHRPVICVIDDAQWLDEASVQTLAFTARRLQAESVGMVFAERAPAATLELHSLPELIVTGLSDRHASTLLASALPGPIDRRVRERIIAETGGNPLALLQLPHRLTPEQVAGGFGFAGAGALTRQLEASFQRRLARMPTATRRLLVVAAAEPGQEAAVIWKAAARLGVTMRDAEPAVADGLIDLTGLVRFCHPLARSTVYRAALADERRTAHRALADATDADADPERRAWHRAQATSGLDEAVAAELHRSAGLAEARGGKAAAAAFLERAAELTPDPRRRAERALLAARAKFDAGAPERALRLLAIARAGLADERNRALVELLHAQIVSRLEPGQGSPLLAAAKRLDPIDPDLARDTYRDAFYAAQVAGQLGRDGGTLEEAAATRLTEHRDPPVSIHDRLLDGVALTVTRDHSAGAPLLREAVAEFRRRELGSDASYSWLPFVTLVAFGMWDEEGAHDVCSRLIALARERGAFSVLPTALMLGVGYEIFAGDLSTAAALAEECDLIREATTIPKPPYGLLMVAAYRGDAERVDAIVDSERLQATDRGEGQWLTASGWAQAVVNNGLGRYDFALAAAERAIVPPNELALVNWAMVELIEAAARSGQPERATEAMRRLTRLSEASGTRWVLGVAARSRALLAAPDHAERHHLAAIEQLQHTRLRTEQARSHLVYGEWLRRQGRRTDAREQLRRAHDLFSDIGADAFADRARRELAATGETVRRRTPETELDLTQQEAQIARLAANGDTNPQIATQLFISPRTVEWHLGKIFAKLAITSRRDLEAALRRGARTPGR